MNARPVSMRRWVGFVVAGEGVGFVAPTAAFALAWSTGLTGWAAFALLVAAGMVEGALLGAGQSLALRGTVAAVRVGRWIAATALAAGFAWSIGMLVPTLSDIGIALDFGSPFVWVVAAVAGIALLASIPLAQWPVLRAAIRPAWPWLPLNMAAWLVGLVFTFLPSIVIDEQTSPAIVAALFVVAGLAMATAVAVITGFGLRRMARRGHSAGH